MVSSAWRSQFERERSTVEALRICLRNLAQMRSSILCPSDATGLGPVQFHLTGAEDISDDNMLQTWTTAAQLFRNILGLPDEGEAPFPFGQFSPPLLQELRKLGRIYEKNIYTVEDIDSYLGSHARWIHFLFADADGWADERGRREVNDFHDEMNACRWIMRRLLVNHCFTIVSISGEWWSGVLLNIECLFYSARPACRRPGGRHAFMMANLSGPRDNGELIATCRLCGHCF